MAGEPLAVPVAGVREVLPAAEPRRLPGQPPGMIGLLEVRGSPLACIDLAARLGLNAPQAGPVAVLKTASGPLGAVVERAEQVIDVTPDAISDIPPEWTCFTAVRAIVSTPGGVVPVLDPAGLSLRGDLQPSDAVPAGR